MKAKEKIRKYLSKSIKNNELHDGENTDFILKDEEDIFDKGLVSSLFAMQLLLFIEKEFDLELDYEDLTLEHVKSINAITHLVETNLYKN